MIQPEFEPAVPETPRPASRVWGPWATIGLGAAVFLVYFAAQSLIAIFFTVFSVLEEFQANPGLDLSRFIQSLTTNGLLISVSTIVSGIAGAGLIVLFISIRKNISIADYLGLKPIGLKTILVLLGIIVGLLAASFGLEQVIDVSEQNFNFMVQTYETAVWLPLLWIAVVIFAPVFEEMFFRGFLLVGLKESRIGALGAVALTSITWAALHIQYNAFGLISILVLGIVMGIVRLKTGSLWSTIFLHSLWNAMAMVQTALYVNGIG